MSFVWQCRSVEVHAGVSSHVFRYALDHTTDAVQLGDSELGERCRELTFSVCPSSFVEPHVHPPSLFFVLSLWRETQGELDHLSITIPP